MGDDSSFCDHLYSTLTIRANGDVVPCCYDLTSEFVIGNIRNESLETIIYSDKRSALISSIARHEYIGPCLACNTVRKSRMKFLCYKQ